MSLNIYFTTSVLAALSVTLVLIGSNIIGVMSILFAQTNKTDCIKYDSLQKLIHISCKSIHLDDIYKSIKNSTILGMENSTGINASTSKGKVWILNAGITIEKSELVIDSTDTSWLKIVPTPTIQKNGQTGLSVDENDEDDTNDDNQVVDAISYPILHTKENDSNNSNTNEQKQIIVNKNNGDSPNGIHVFGSLKIDSVKITS